MCFVVTACDRIAGSELSRFMDRDFEGELDASSSAEDPSYPGSDGRDGISPPRASLSSIRLHILEGVSVARAMGVEQSTRVS